VWRTRRDWHHKLSTKIIRENQAVYVDDLAVSGLARGHLAKSVHDAGWSAFVRMLEYKATKHGRLLLRIDWFEPTTRTCSECGWYGPKLELSVRIFHVLGAASSWIGTSTQHATSSPLDGNSPQRYGGRWRVQTPVETW
jgi:putative transposase